MTDQSPQTVEITAGELTGAHVGFLISLHGKNTSQLLEGTLASVKLERPIRYRGNDILRDDLEVTIEVVFGESTFRVELPHWVKVVVPAYPPPPRTRPSPPPRRRGPSRCLNRNLHQRRTP